MQYIRFQTSKIDIEWSTKPFGIFQLAYKLRDSGIPDFDADYLEDILRWFDDHLDVPNNFSRKKTRSYATRWISRYKDTAKEHISYMHELKRMFEEYEIYVEVMMTDTPGYIVYEDEYQIVAEPYK